jgi:two-component system response regulator YesN
MLKVLIVDDDILVRVGLRMMIDWLKYGWEIVGEASNGIQALDSIEELAPNVLIMDMKMPQMDGAELLKVLSKKAVKLKILVLSCYDDYNYMREALTSGANEYILKPELNKEMLTETLCRIEQQIKDQEKKNKEFNQLKNQAALYAYKAHETFYHFLLRGKYTNKDELEAAIQFYEIDIKETFFCVAIFSMDDRNQTELAHDPGKQDALVNSLFSIIQGLLQAFSYSYLFRDEISGDFISILNVASEAKWNEIETVANQAIQAASVYTHLEVTVGLSSITNDILQLSQEFQHANEALRHRLLFDGGKVISYSTLAKENSSLRDYLKQLQHKYDDLFAALMADDEEQSKQSMLNLLAFIRESVSMRLLQAFCSELVSWYNKQLHFADMDGILDGNPAYMSVEDLLNSCTTAELVNIFVQKCRLLIRNVFPIHQMNLAPAIKKAIEYISLNYDREINLQDISYHVGFSKSHFSVMFREHTGINFVEYLTTFRIELAMRLLRKHDMKIYEIATKVGFDNERYFSQVFRAKLGVTPTEYKKNLSNPLQSKEIEGNHNKLNI